MSRIAIGLALTAAAVSGLPAAAGAVPLSARDSFRIGSGGSVLVHRRDPRRRPRAVGNVRPRLCDRVPRRRGAGGPDLRAASERARPGAASGRVRDEQAVCGAPANAPLEGVGAVEVTDCKLKGADVVYRVYQARKGAILYSAEGFAGYDSALRLGLRSVIADKALPGELSIATTGVGDAAALARVQAGALDASRALAEAYRRNNSGSYAKLAEFFASVSQGGDSQSKAEGLVNEALQKSNLGRYDEADALFGRAAQLVGGDPIVARQYRNYRAMHLLNRGDAKAAMAELDKPVPPARRIRTTTSRRW